MPWIKIYCEMVHEPSIQMLPAREFRKKFLACIAGEINEFSEFIKVDSGRVFSKEWREIRSLIFERDDYTCRYCGARGGKLECDHIHPVSRGGPTNEANLATACKPCNRDKGNKTVREWMA